MMIGGGSCTITMTVSGFGDGPPPGNGAPAFFLGMPKIRRNRLLHRLPGCGSNHPDRSIPAEQSRCQGGRQNALTPQNEKV